jgi:tryptophan synthase alpha chain
MGRIAETFTRLQHEQRIALMPYLMIGFPQRESILELVPALEAAGADMFELGIPFSDPLADGATIQRASERALKNNVHISYCIESVARLREQGVQPPLLLMGYYNPILRYGIERACKDLAAVGGDGWIIPDLPPEESNDLRTHADAYGLEVILFIAPTTPPERMAMIAKMGKGFLYCVSVTGVTGARKQVDQGLDSVLASVRQHTNTPLVVGFGISTGEHIRKLTHIADGAIVGSALINIIDQSPPEQMVKRATAFIQDLQHACKKQP